ncbi:MULTISPECIES: SDR family NAD(P)-dependent oxidoreductase [unclassified Streptomyces]|uniref:SDR family NAD(P)-dependent oxidoreductase n=1 Tax=unclassified Streptomyces TaxID=2593676 RepID=UPI00093BB19A|nr:SDR family NAD(P)-dependent oxidoreductase [Streptomyces sp. CB02058]OKI95631.1 short-chain dehydrogenase [Streptomyces sp. CB02058]
MTTTLITGANKGLGYETARRLIEAGHTVYAGARDARRGEEAAKRLGARFVRIDITDQESVDAAAEFVRKDAGRLDVLVNNAGIAGVHKPVGETSGADMRLTYETNVFGAVRMTRAFLPLLEAGDASVVVNVASGLGSLAATNDPGRVEFTVAALDYTSSKTALVMVNSQYAKAYPGIRFNAVDPGYTATDLNGHSGPKTVEEGADIIVRMALIGADGPTGGFFDAEGVAAW